jgi:hypothetical protein
VLNRICNFTSAQSPSLVGELVFGYLRHHGHWDSAAAVARDVLGGAVAVSPRDVQDMRVGRRAARAALGTLWLLCTLCCEGSAAWWSWAWGRIVQRRLAVGGAVGRAAAHHAQPAHCVACGVAVILEPTRLPRSTAASPLQMRQQVCERVAGGDIDAALELLEQLAPGLLAADTRIHFRLQCQKFAEMVRRFNAFPFLSCVAATLGASGEG